jgi:hypothetical protein
LIGVPRVFFESDIFTSNGDATSNSLLAYGAGILTPKTGEISIDSVLTSYGTYPGSVLCRGMIKITRSAQLQLKALTFNGNWLLETSYDGYRAQLVTVSQFWG